jgi:DegV family protein with EDD domain
MTVLLPAGRSELARIAVVTDSTCDMGPETLAAIGVPMVPLKLHIEDKTYQDWVDFTPETFYPMLAAASKLPTTSQPSPAEFAKVFADLAAEGYEGVVSIHLGAKLSGTYESAHIAAADSPIPVRVIDTKVVSWAIALVVQAAVAARDAGEDLDAVEAAAQKAADGVELFFVLDTLDNLVKGGRAGKAQGLAASLLNIKAVLHFDDGVIVPFQKARGTKAAVALLAQHVADRSNEVGGVKAIVLHALVPDLAVDVIDALKVAEMQGEIAGTGLIGAVIGNHAGARAVGVAYLPLS